MTNIHEKISNLLALARNNPSEEEAATAFNMARRLMLKHNIAEADLGHKSSVEYHRGQSIDRDYFKLLASGISQLIPVAAVITHDQHIKWAGTSVNAQIANDLLTFWADQVEALYKIHLPRGLSKTARAQYRKDFKRNCAIGIIHRAREIKKTQISEESGTALVVVEDQLMGEVEAFLSKQNIRLTKPLKIRSSTMGAIHGRIAAKSVNLQRGVK